MKEGMEIIDPYIKGEGAKRRGKMVIATVEGDNHDLGKTIMTTLLIAQNFEVVDLGIDVPTEKIIEVAEASDSTVNPDLPLKSPLRTITLQDVNDLETKQPQRVKRRPTRTNTVIRIHQHSLYTTKI